MAYLAFVNLFRFLAFLEFLTKIDYFSIFFLILFSPCPSSVLFLAIMTSTAEALMQLIEWIEANGLREDAKQMLDGRLKGQAEGLCREFKAMEERARFAEEKLLAFEKANERLSGIAADATGALNGGIALANKLAISQGRGKSHGGHHHRHITAGTPKVTEVCGTCHKDKCSHKSCDGRQGCKEKRCHGCAAVESA